MEGRVLIVENDPTVLRLAADFLRYDGHTVVTAGDGEEGLQAFSTGKFDVVVTDVKMPKMDGIEMMKAMKALDPAIEVIVLTGYGTFEMTIEVIRNGGYDFLRKPDDVAQRIRPTVQRAIERRHLGLKNEELVNALETANTDLEKRVHEKTQEADRLAAQHAVTRILAESSALTKAAPRVLTTLLDTLGWGIGIIWQADRYASILRCVDACHTAVPTMARFADQRKKGTFSPDIGLPGKVWTTRRHLLDLDSTYYQSDLEDSADIRGMGFPIVVGDEVLGVLEFCDPNLEEPDENLLQIMGTIGTQLGLFFERERLENQVRQSQKMEAIGRLAGGIAHDFNNLLTSIIGYAHLIEKRVDIENPLHRNATQIQKTGHRAAALIQQLLAFSRRQVLKPEILLLNDVFSNLDTMLDRLLAENIEVQVELDPTIEAIFADQTQIEQVIMNLAVNARDAMPSGGILKFITVSTSLDEHNARLLGLTPGPYVQLVVSDTGHGMDDAVQAHLFEPFYTTKEQGKGTGLGLATVYGIVTQSDGQIKVKSKTGEGTTFTIYLPVSNEHETSATESIYRPPAGAQAKAGMETILLVEDEDELREMVKQIIQGVGYSVLEAGNGADALAVFEKTEQPISLVITDVAMPMMNGDEMAQRLIRSHPDIRIIFITGYADDSLVQHTVFATGVPLLEKPFTPSDLLHAIREELDAPQPSYTRKLQKS